MKYSVVRTKTISEFAVVEAESEDEAVDQAKFLDNDSWNKNSNDSFFEACFDPWEYSAQLCNQ